MEVSDSKSVKNEGTESHMNTADRETKKLKVEGRRWQGEVKTHTGLPETLP